MKTLKPEEATPKAAVQVAHAEVLATITDAGWVLENDLIRATFNSMPVTLGQKATVEVMTGGPLLDCLRMTRQVNTSEMRQEIRLRRGSRRLDFVTTVFWNEKHKLLKVAFPLAVHPEEALHEIQLGHVRRPNHASRKNDADRFEVPQQRWTALVEEGRGAALFNDCKYGINVTSNRIQLTLLKSAIAPDPHADEGGQEFTYSLTTWNGPFFDCAVVREAYELNAPLTVTPDAPSAPEASLFQVDAPSGVCRDCQAGRGLLRRFGRPVV